MRGSLTFQELFSDITVTLPARQVKGRCNELNARRDELLLSRYYFYGRYSQLRYEVVICKLSNEFFLTERRIHDIISSNHDLLKKLRDDPPAISEMKKRWPHLVW